MTDQGQRGAMEKAKGGRGHKAENKYVKVSVSLPPQVVALLDQHAGAAERTRSEMVAGMIERYSRMWPIREKNR